MTARSWSFVLPYERAPKGLNANDRAHWRTRGKSTAEVRAEVVMAADWKARIPKLSRCRVDVTWVVNTRHRRDEDNLAPFLKAIYDGLGADKGVSAHIVPDDAPEFMSKPGATIRYEKGATAHFVVTVTELNPKERVMDAEIINLSDPTDEPAEPDGFAGLFDGTTAALDRLSIHPKP